MSCVVVNSEMSKRNLELGNKFNRAAHCDTHGAKDRSPLCYTFSSLHFAMT